MLENKFWKISLVLFLICISQVIYGQEIIEDSLGFIWKKSKINDSVYELDSIIQIGLIKTKSLKYNNFEKYFLNYIGLKSKRKTNSKCLKTIMLYQEDSGIVIEMSFKDIKDLFLHYSAIINDINLNIKAEQNMYYLENDSAVIGRGISWSGGDLLNNEIDIYIKISTGLIYKSKLKDYQILNPILRIECVNFTKSENISQ